MVILLEYGHAWLYAEVGMLRAGSPLPGRAAGVTPPLSPLPGQRAIAQVVQQRSGYQADEVRAVEW